MAIHVASLVLVHVDSITGEVFTKDGSKMDKFTSLKSPTVSAQRAYSTEFRLQPDPAIANTAGYPTIPAYLALEAGSGFKFKHLDQTYVITES